MNPIVWSNLINGSIACRVMVGVDSIAWKETKLPYCYIKAVFRALALPFTPFLKRFHLPVISYSSSIHFMRFTFPSGEASPHWWAPKWSECKELWWKIHQSEEKGKLNMVPIIAEKSPWFCLVYNQDISQCLLKCPGKHFHLMWAKFRWFC